MLMQDGPLRSSEYFTDAILLINLITSLMDGHAVSSKLPEFLEMELRSWEIGWCSFSLIPLLVYCAKVWYHKQTQDLNSMTLLAIWVSFLYHSFGQNPMSPCLVLIRSIGFCSLILNKTKERKFCLDQSLFWVFQQTQLCLQWLTTKDFNAGELKFNRVSANSHAGVNCEPLGFKIKILKIPTTVCI